MTKTKFKLFCGTNIENEINVWLQNHPNVVITQMSHSADESTSETAFFYIEEKIEPERPSILDMILRNKEDNQ